ncbi:hypothetical protein MQA23_07905, partial [Escherichia coli]|nr:hypothetical protein [Escherichia coli]
ALLYIIIATGMGLLISTFMKSQIAAIFGTAIITLIPATQFSGTLHEWDEGEFQLEPPLDTEEGRAAADEWDER